VDLSGSKNHILGGGPNPPQQKDNLGSIFQPIVKYREYPKLAKVISVGGILHFLKLAVCPASNPVYTQNHAIRMNIV